MRLGGQDVTAPTPLLCNSKILMINIIGFQETSSKGVFAKKVVVQDAVAKKTMTEQMFAHRSLANTVVAPLMQMNNMKRKMTMMMMMKK